MELSQAKQVLGTSGKGLLVARNIPSFGTEEITKNRFIITTKLFYNDVNKIISLPILKSPSHSLSFIPLKQLSYKADVQNIFQFWII